MRIVNPQIRPAIEAGTGLRLNLGCGMRRLPGYFGVDHIALPNTDIVADLNEPLHDLPDNCVERIFTRHTLEHVENFMPLMAELHRITRPDGQIDITVPHFSNPYGYSDPTHVRQFGLYTFYYFADEVDQPRRKVPAFYVPERFIVDKVQIRLLKRSWVVRPFTLAVEWLINRGVRMLDWYERTLCWTVPADSIRYRLRVKKPAHAKAQVNRAA